MEKLCVFCTNFGIYTGSSGTFDESSGDMSCRKDHFKDRQNVFPSYDESDLRSVIFYAETCQDYNQVKIDRK